jgi:cytoskeletal protein CcmA (bactofilin family)
MSSVLGETGLVLGNVGGNGDLEVRGRVQGDVILQGRCAVGDGGTVLGRIEATFIAIAGTVRGDLLAADGVSISASATVEGNIEAPRVEIEAGALVRGQLRTTASRSLDSSEAELGVASRTIAATPTLDRDDTRQAGSFEGISHDGQDPAVRELATAPRVEGGLPDETKPRRRRRRRRGGAQGSAPEGASAQAAPALPAESDADSADEAVAKGEPSSADAPRGRRGRTEAGPPPDRESELDGHPRAPGRKKAPGKPPKLPTFVKGARGHLRH